MVLSGPVLGMVCVTASVPLASCRWGTNSTLVLTLVYCAGSLRTSGNCLINVLYIIYNIVRCYKILMKQYSNYGELRYERIS